ncbi:(E3-independent) E2 ubiquitin-conjugating enzyme [Culicoides brevitarsis]|uniref:(E3-independent) E2 ubiquitin-conjugating enzyme n=1 Tax=Culicoides brevitarsis TaxID=469753 RepID=UPI00307C385C
MTWPQTMNQAYFYEDQVFKFTKKNVKFGLVIENYEAVNSTDEEFEDSLKQGEIRVAWYPEGKEEILPESNVFLADRTLMPGDVVRRMTVKGDSQRGYCREVFVKADVRILGTKYVIKNVPSDRLKPLETMPRDNAVCLDSWVGSTKNINEKLTLKSTCGSILEIRPDIEYCPLKDVVTKTRSGLFAGQAFYPGQVLVGNVSELENAIWIRTSPEMRTSRKHKTVDRKFSVESVEIEGVWVNWQCKASCEDSVIDASKKGGTGIQQPACYVTGDDLKRIKRLNLFEPCMLQINDKNFLKIEEGDVMIRKSQWKKEQNNRFHILKDQLQLKQQELAKAITKDVKVINVVEPPTITANDETAAATTTTPTINSSTTTHKQQHADTNGCDKTRLCPNSISGALAQDHDTNTNHTKEIGSKETGTQQECAYNNKCYRKSPTESDEWKTEEDDETAFVSDSNTTVSSCSSSATPKSSPKKSPLLVNKIRRLKKRDSTSSASEKIPAVGEEVITECLVVYSSATVVWQDGTIETDIHSTELCPIHHLDDHEFFPGDFVLLDDGTNNTSYRDYGVIQKVDHLGRVAKVKWFSTYSCMEEPRPTYKGESEVSVYNLKDHPDFQYRPGTIVIRVANFVGEDKNCTAGQVIDNFCEGYVRVWWVDDGHISNCFPQDLFEVGQYDSENNFWSNDDSDNDSWETEEETSELGGMPPKEVSKPQLVANLERARVAMAKLEEIFIINPTLQNQNVMKKLLLVYKKCRYLDRLMGTSFFHEEHFQGLVERVRKGGHPSTAERVQDLKNRLFSDGTSTSAAASELAVTFIKKIKLSHTKSESNSHEDTSCSSMGSSSANNKGLLNPSSNTQSSKHLNKSTSSEISSLDETDCHPLTCKDDDSGHFSKTETTQVTQADTAIETTDPNSDCVCARLCALIKAQLVKALQEINSRYCQTDTFKEIIEEYEIEPATDELHVELPETPQDNPTEEEKPLSDDATTAANDAAIPNPDAVEYFQIVETAPSSHKFHLTVFHPTNAQNFFKTVHKEHHLLRTSLPPGVWVRSFEDRLDLMSFMIEGPKKTPYEGGLFLFDIQLGPDYPRTPPLCHYISFCSDRLNPNLYEDGKVCVSLLGTWQGRGTEVWGPTSTLLQLIVSIQGLILVDEPYFNEAGYEKQKGSQQGSENSRMYNEMVILKLVQSMTKLIISPPPVFREQILKYFKENGNAMYQRIKSYMEMSDTPLSDDESSSVKIRVNGIQLTTPEFPLIPASRGFCLTLVGVLDNFHKKLQAIAE